MIPKFSKKILKNGMEIYCVPFANGSNVVSVDLIYKVGSRNETMGKSGIAHMLEHMNFKSTKNHKSGEFDKIIKEFGGVNNASTGFDYTHYFVKCASQNFKICLELYADIMQNLNLLDEEFQTERDVVLEERLWRTDNDPFGYMFFRLYNTAFLYHPYHWTPIGFKDDIKNWKIQDIKQFHKIFYQPQNSFLIVCGDIDEEDVFESVENYFGDIKNSVEIPSNHKVEPSQDGEKSAIIYKETDVEYLAMAYKIPPFSSKDTLILEAITLLLGVGKSSIFEKSLVDEKMILSNVECFLMSSLDENLLIIFGVCNPEISAKIAKKEILKILENKLTIDDEDILKVKNLMISDFVYSFDSASKISSIFADFIVKSKLEEIYEMKDRIKNITKDQILSVYEKYFDRKNLTTLILKNSKKG